MKKEVIEIFNTMKKFNQSKLVEDCHYGQFIKWYGKMNGEWFSKYFHQLSYDDQCALTDELYNVMENI